jgi:hypothetical protein
MKLKDSTACMDRSRIEVGCRKGRIKSNKEVIIESFTGWWLWGADDVAAALLLVLEVMSMGAGSFLSAS